jgi:hypothetical protein
VRTVEQSTRRESLERPRHDEANCGKNAARRCGESDNGNTFAHLHWRSESVAARHYCVLAGRVIDCTVSIEQLDHSDALSGDFDDRDIPRPQHSAA